MKWFVIFTSFAIALPSFLTPIVNTTFSLATAVVVVGGTTTISAPCIVVSAVSVSVGWGVVFVVTLALFVLVPREAFVGTLTLK